MKHHHIQNKKTLSLLILLLKLTTHLKPEDLASILIFIEEKLERKRKHKNDPRTCDIDIIDYNGSKL